ncbi:putative ribonuclease H [Helianthus anomalus]
MHCKTRTLMKLLKICIETLDLGIPEIPSTKGWLEHHKHSVFGFPSLVRFSWGTCESYFKGGVEVLWEADEADDGSSKNTVKR